MRKWLLTALLVVFLSAVSTASAQTNITLASMQVQLWPEYDQPSMLVITDFKLAEATSFPTDLTFRIPLDANLIAVAAYDNTGNLINAVFDGPNVEGDYQAFTITMEAASGRFEYYQPLTFSGTQRTYIYSWDGTYAVDAFEARVLEPLDTTSLTTVPKLDSISQENGAKYFQGKPVKLGQGEEFKLNLQYNKTSDSLIASAQGVQPSAPVDENTTGRISINNYLPYIIGGIGVLLIAGGLVYYFRAGSSSTKRSRRRAHSGAEEEGAGAAEDVYCPQCGTRAKPNDRFCRTCGARLRRPEE